MGGLWEGEKSKAAGIVRVGDRGGGYMSMRDGEGVGRKSKAKARDWDCNRGVKSKSQVRGL